MPDFALRAETARERHRKAQIGEMHTQLEHIMNVISRACIDPHVVGPLCFRGQLHPANRKTLLMWGYVIEEFTGTESHLEGEAGNWLKPHFSVWWSE